MTEPQVGEKILHSAHGPCRVTFVGEDYIGILTEQSQNGLIRKDSEECVPWSEENEAIWLAAVSEQKRQMEVEENE